MRRKDEHMYIRNVHEGHHSNTIIFFVMRIRQLYLLNVLYDFDQIYLLKRVSNEVK